MDIWSHSPGQSNTNSPSFLAQYGSGIAYPKSSYWSRLWRSSVATWRKMLSRSSNRKLLALCICTQHPGTCTLRCSCEICTHTCKSARIFRIEGGRINRRRRKRHATLSYLDYFLQNHPEGLLGATLQLAVSWPLGQEVNKYQHKGHVLTSDVIGVLTQHPPLGICR